MSVFSSARKKTPLQQGNRRRPRLETLESRQMLSADPWLDSLDRGGRDVVDHHRPYQQPWSGPADSVARGSAREATVMSWNLYLGGDLAPVLNAVVAGDPQQIVQASSTLWQSVLATNFEVRAEAIADQIELAQPTLIGLQEAVMWRTGPVSPDPAEDVQFDFTQILLDELNERGLHYGLVAETQGLDAELTGFTTLPDLSNPAGVLEDIRLTDHDVILARTDLPKSQLKLSNVMEDTFDISLSLPGGVFTVPRGWNSVDVKIRGKEFRLINTHLEIAAFPQLQVAQASELLSTAAATDMAVVLLGDFNTSAVPGQPDDTPTYELLLEAGFEDTWNSTRITETFTCCQAPDLRNEPSIERSRIDFVFVRGALEVIDADVVGEEQADRSMPLPDAPLGLWPSDHAGVLASLVLPSRQRGPQQFQFVDTEARVIEGHHLRDEQFPVEEVTSKRSGDKLLQAIDNIWRHVGRKKHEMLTASSDRFFDVDEEDTGRLFHLTLDALVRGDAFG